MLELADSLGVEFLTYSAESLQEISAVSSSSEFVRGVTGVDNVCERAAKKNVSGWSDGSGKGLSESVHGCVCLW